ncbi:MAG: serine/threonine protein kinase, partial [Chthonomonadaceae bacterium]|nr:serine/threonine protein kinase [Chthonomonadaceae bacterium]
MIGTRVAGRYDIEEQIGIGGMGIVYRAYDSRLKRHVALKVIAPHLVQQEAARAQFLREAQALAGLMHPNIVTVFDLCEEDATQAVFIVMELLRGSSLRHCLADPMRPVFSQIALPLCRALEAAHARGVLHRDIKPENVFVCEDGTIKLMDFGLARLLTANSRSQASLLAGTLAYMAPEQLKG